MKLRSSKMSNRVFLRCFFVHEGKVHIDLKLTAEITFCTAKIQHIPVEIKNRNCVINSNRVIALHIINIFLNYQTRCWQREEKIWTEPNQGQEKDKTDLNWQTKGRKCLQQIWTDRPRVGAVDQIFLISHVILEMQNKVRRNWVHENMYFVNSWFGHHSNFSCPWLITIIFTKNI